MTSPVPSAIERLFASREFITSGEVAAAANVSRQAAHYHLKAMERRGDIVHEGAGRGGRYRRRTDLETRYPIDGLAEHEVWADDYLALKKMDPPALDNPNVKPILDYAFTEMVNNAIDHSGGSTVTTRWFRDRDCIAFEVEDDGVGALRRMRETRGLNDDFDAIGEIAKGKQTSAPDHHSGLGIYFSSRMVNRFSLSSGHLTWTADRDRHDEAVGWLDKPRKGTLVRCEIAATTRVTPQQVFDEFSDPQVFGSNKSTVRMALFTEGDFVSRSEAKRVAANLDTFDVVELDFSGINQVGQGFVDELFRVWQREHPQTRLIPVNANPAIMSMITRTVPAASFEWHRSDRIEGDEKVPQARRYEPADALRGPAGHGTDDGQVQRSEGRRAGSAGRSGPG
jgi:hypothetical protein